MSIFSKGKQKPLKVCEQYASEHGLLLNSLKTKCMIFKRKGILLSNTQLCLHGSMWIVRNTLKVLLILLVSCMMLNGSHGRFNPAKIHLHQGLETAQQKFIFCYILFIQTQTQTHTHIIIF